MPLVNVLEETLAGRFRLARERAGLTRSALAAPRYTLSYVSQIESGRRQPSQEALEYFAERVGVSENFLRTGLPDGLGDELAFRLEEARILLTKGDVTEAGSRLSDVRERSARYALGRLQARAKALEGHVWVRQGNIRRAIDLYEEAIEEGLPEREEGMTTAALARAYEAVGDLSYAAELIESYFKRTASRPLDPGLAAELNTVLVSIYFERGDVVKAERVAGKAIETLDESVAPHVRANVFWAAARVLAEASRWEEALELAARARIILEEVGDRWRLAGIHNAYAFLCLETDPPRTEEARQHLETTEALLGPGAPPGQIAYLHSEKARLALIQDRPSEALRSSEDALVLVEDDRLERARALYLRGRALVRLEQPERAVDSFYEAAAAFAKSGARQQEASCWREIGEIELNAGNAAEAIEALRAGLEVLEPRRTRP